MPAAKCDDYDLPHKAQGLAAPVPATRLASWHLLPVVRGGFAVDRFLAHAGGQPLIMGSFGASIFVLFVVPESPFAQPQCCCGAHSDDSDWSRLFYWVSPEWWSMAIALTVAITLIQFLRVPHPPAGSNPVIVFLSFRLGLLVHAALIGAVILVAVAAVYNNLSSHQLSQILVVGQVKSRGVVGLCLRTVERKSWICKPYVAASLRSKKLCHRS